MKISKTHALVLNLALCLVFNINGATVDEKENDEPACRKRLYKCKRMEPTFQTFNNELSEHIDLDSLPGISATKETGTSE